MLMILAVVFLALWLLGFVTGFTVGGLIHILPALVALIVFYRLYQTRLIR